jgi:hypothetical protein
MHPGALPPPVFFSAHFFTFWRAINSDTINALLFSKHASELFLLFSRNNVAKEYEILRKMDKKMSKNATRRNTFGKKRAGYNINGPNGLKSGWRINALPSLPSLTSLTSLSSLSLTSLTYLHLLFVCLI